jgi:hypothetical protein
MLTLTRATPATFIHGVTGQDVEDTTLDPGTQFTIDGIYDGRVCRWVTILVPSGLPTNNGWYRYRVAETDLEAR